MTGTVQYVTLPSGIRLEYEERGDPDGVPVLLLHGVTDSRRSWDPVLPHLPPSIRAIALTQRGHGESDRPAAGYAIEDMAGDAAAVIDALRLGPAVVVGHSMGTWVAERLAIDSPERVLATVVAAGPGAPRDSEAWLWRDLFSGFLDIDLFEGLASLEPPALLVWGDRDALVRRVDQDRLLAAIPDARLAVYEGTGHAVHWEEPQRFAAQLAAFALAHASRGATVAP